MPQALVTLFACAATLAAGQTPPAPADVAFFEAKVRPLLVERCHSCHSTKAKKQRGGLLLDSRPSILAGGDSRRSAGVPAAAREVECRECIARSRADRPVIDRIISNLRNDLPHLR